MSETYQIKDNTLVGYPDHENVIVIPDGIHAIESYLFDDSCISYLAMPESVKTLGVQTFCWCDRLCIIDFSKHIKRLERDVFNSIAAYRLNPPESLVYIGNAAFQGSLSLLFFQFPDNVIFIADRAFHHCVSMRYVTFGNQLKYIGENAFSSTALEYLYLPESLISIGRYAFADCENLCWVTLKEGLLSIDEAAFRGCVSLKCIEIPDSVVSISKRAFADCDSLETIELPEKFKNVSMKDVFPFHTKIVFRNKTGESRVQKGRHTNDIKLIESQLHENENEMVFGTAESSYAMGCYYLFVKQDEKKAKAYMEQAAAQGFVKAHYQLYFLDKSQNKRVHLLRAATLGCEKAVYELIKLLG